MSDGRKNNGGHSTKGVAGRKPKAEEQKLIEKLTPLEDSAFKALKKGITENHSWAVKMYFEYMYGKPKETILQKNINYNQDLTPEEAAIINKELENKY